MISKLKIWVGLILVLISFKTMSQSRSFDFISIYDSLDIDRSQEYKLINKYGDTLLYLFKHQGDDYRYLNTLLFVYESQLNNAAYNEALSTLSLSMLTYNNHPFPDSPILATIYTNYGSLYAILNVPSKANYYIQLGLNSWNMKWRDNTSLIRMYLLKGNLSKNPKTELHYYRLALETSIESGNLKMQEHSYSALGVFTAENNDFKAATNYFREALVLALNRNAYSTLSSIYNNLAGISTNPKMVSRFVDSAYHYALISGNLEDQQICLLNKAYLFTQQNKYNLGYNTLWEAYVLQDSIFSQRKIKAFADMEQKYESKKKSDEIALLKSENEVANLQASRRLSLIIGLGGALFTFIVVAYAFYVQNKKRKKLNEDLSSEKKKSDDLLLNILPEEVADELKHTGFSKARLYNNVTVLFTDFVNFTGISEKLTPTELVQEIHKNFTAFDSIIEKHGLEKIKTIGDAYLAVCGLPHELPDHAIRVTKAAIDIRNFMLQNEGKFQIRIGIHSGPVVAGIVGVKKYAYDIWGDTVNMANRMESNSEAGKINISGATYELIQSQFECIYRGKIQAKNKGEVDMYFV